jgi:segregation and condensation protein A
LGRNEADFHADEGVEASAELIAATRGFTLKLPAFEGPLDLLLHLIREHRLDVFDIPISFILDEYLGYLARMRELNLDVASEFLVMAATLAHIKSRMLLPKKEQPPEEVEEDFGDPRTELVRRLLEYQKYRAAAEDLGRQDLLGRSVFTREVKVAEVPFDDGEIGLREVSVLRLIEAFSKVLETLTPEKQHEVTLERISIGDAISRIAEMLLRHGGETPFSALFDGAKVRHEVIATFLGLLEMVRLKLVRVTQEAHVEEIFVVPTDRLGMDQVDLQDDYA